MCLGQTCAYPLLTSASPSAPVDWTSPVGTSYVMVYPGVLEPVLESTATPVTAPAPELLRDVGDGGRLPDLFPEQDRLAVRSFHSTGGFPQRVPYVRRTRRASCQFCRCRPRPDVIYNATTTRFEHNDHDPP